MSTKKTYKQLEQELSEILDRVDTATYDDLDTLMKDYKAGTLLVDELQDQLIKAKNTIKKAKK